ncbi:CYTH domain-containing protein [Bacillus sp. KH172YL63]|uniref:CYTH domain-containing protein n=1 Tax=Bacillus sp. KH172YL63 TaxID=2709784 RepID=UPI0013E4B8CF|nr:CYTH domain-containing protein [Bacillus sp. KH172YL63]BCB03052.1 putative triphosphatase YjbK [Bacillus sp. KH172YL63]
MAQEIEIEFKNLVTEEEFLLLTDHFHISEENFISQDNHYFDTVDFQLKNKHSALRIRQKDGTYTLTLKTPLKEDLLETHQPLSKEEAVSLLAGGTFPQGEVTEALQSMEINCDALELFGTLTTTRAEIDYKEGLLVFDKSSYLGKEDFELEYEAKERKSGEAAFRELLKQLNIPMRKTDNKIKRFYMEKFKQR